MNKQEILLDIKAHQRDINQCIGDLVEARIFPNKCKELNAYERMESLLAKTNQMCSVIIDYLTQSEYAPTDKTMIERAVEWLSLHAELYGGFNAGRLNDLVGNFKQAMEK